MRHLILVVLFASLFAEDAPKLDRLELSNGRSLVGTVELETNDAYTVRLAAGGGGSIIVAKAKVTKIERGVEEMPAPIVAGEPRAANASKPAKVKAVRPVDPIAEMRADAKSRGMNVTKAMLAVLKTDMPFNDVVKILGANYTTHQPMAGIVKAGALRHNWINKDGSAIYIEFHDGLIFNFGEVYVKDVSLK